MKRTAQEIEDSESDEEEEIQQALIAGCSKNQLAEFERLKKGQTSQIVPCRTAIARRILTVLDEKPKKSEFFLPGRMSYIISLDEDGGSNSITTLLRSKADVNSSNDGGIPNETDFGLDQLVNILSRVRQSVSKKARAADQDEDDYLS